MLTYRAMERRHFLKHIFTGLGGLILGITGGKLLQKPATSQNKSIPKANISTKTYHWKMVTAWPKNFPGLGTGAAHLADTITRMTDGRIQIKVYGAGELVPAFGVFDAVSGGSVEMGHSAAYYWKGKAVSSQFFASIPFGLNTLEMGSWIQSGGGQALWDELYARFNLKPFAAGSTGQQMGGWFNREINTVSDYKGLKIRMPGLGGEVLRAVGATVVNLPGGEIFQSMQTGAIDATEWVGPYNDMAFGLYKTAKNYYWPGWHEPGSIIECMVNKETYDALPSDLKLIVEQAGYQHMLFNITNRNSLALTEMVTKQGVKLKRFPDSVLKKMGAISKDVVSNIAGKDPFAQKVYASYTNYRSKSLEWDYIGEQGYSLARHLTFS